MTILGITYGEGGSDDNPPNGNVIEQTVVIADDGETRTLQRQTPDGKPIPDDIDDDPVTWDEDTPVTVVSVEEKFTALVTAIADAADFAAAKQAAADAKAE